MGGCAGKEGSLFEEFNVTNINDQHRLVHSGIMYVTDSDLIYIDKKSHEKWEWPLKFLRRYGCEGHVFSFEAGRKCPSGEGLYAFNCKKANALFNRVAQNISQGNLEPTEPELPERNTEVPFPPKVQHTHSIPNGSSATLPNSSSTIPNIPPPLPPTPPPTNQNGQSNVNYTDLEFKKGVNEKPPPGPGDLVNYTRIDMPKTIEVSRLRQKVEFHGNNAPSRRRQTTGNLPSHKKRNKGGSRSSTDGSTSSLNADPQQIRIRSLDDDHRSHLRKGSAPDLRITGQQRTSPPLLPATVAEAPSENDIDPYKSTAEPNYLNVTVGPGEDQHNYSNMSVGVVQTEQNYANINVGGDDEPNYTNISVGNVSEIRRPSIGGADSSEHNYSNITVGMESEHNYTNISVGLDSLSTSVSQQQQSNYQNLIPGQGLVSSTPVTTPTQGNPSGLLLDPSSPSFSHPRSSTFNHSQLKPSGSSSSSTLPAIKGGGNTMQTYIELEMSSKASTTLGSMSSYVELDIGPDHQSSLTLVSEEGRQRSQSALVQPYPIPDDSPDTLYKELNFTEMNALHAIAQERENLKNALQPTTTHVDTDKKHKSKK